jgi:hypothetical protein
VDPDPGSDPGPQHYFLAHVESFLLSLTAPAKRKKGFDLEFGLYCRTIPRTLCIKAIFALNFKLKLIKIKSKIEGKNIYM